MKILLVDDHEIVRSGLVQMLDVSPSAEYIEARGYSEALRLAKKHKPALAIVDLSLSDGSGIDLISEIGALSKSTVIVALSMYEDVYFALRALNAGVRAYVTKLAADVELKQAIQKALSGEIYVDRGVAAKLSGSRSNGSPEFPALSDREQRILELIGEGLDNAHIAIALGVSTKTLSNTLTGLKVKLRLSSTADFARIAKWSKPQ